MRVCVIPPTVNARDLCMVEGGAIHLVLSHWVRQSTEYGDFYRDLPKEDFVILDNGAHETGVGDDFDQLSYAIDLVEPDEVVLPDRLFFGDDTFDLSVAAFEPLRKRFPNLRFMAVPQGRTDDEWYLCLERLSELPINTIGISKDYEVWEEGLPRLVEAVEPELDIHLLGWARDLYQPVWVEERCPGRVRSVDTAKGVVYAQNGIRLEHCINRETVPPKYPRRSESYLQSSLTPTELRLAISNIGTFRRSVGDTSKFPSNPNLWDIWID